MCSRGKYDSISSPRIDISREMGLEQGSEVTITISLRVLFSLETKKPAMNRTKPIAIPTIVRDHNFMKSLVASWVDPLN